MIAIGGGLALLGNLERLIGIATELTQDTGPTNVWEIKVLVILGFLANAFLKFVWANRLYDYCAILMAAVHNDPGDALATPRAHKAGEVNITAAGGLSRGLRSVYFALATPAWTLGPEALLMTTAITCLVLLRREFAAHSRQILVSSESATPNTQT